jgi:hypothetical protein
LKPVRLSAYALLALAVVPFMTGEVRSQDAVGWSVFDQGFAASAGGNSVVLSILGQPLAGSARGQNTSIAHGFLADPSLPGALTAVGEDAPDVPLTYELSQNYPNPFNPTTLIRFSIPERKHVTLKIYDVIGREVASLVNEERDAGVYEVRFDAKSLSSGAYFYRLVAGTYVQLKKLMILK